MHDIADTPIAHPAVFAKTTHGISATLANQQSLKKIFRPLLRQAMTLFVLAQLFLHRFEKRFLDDRRHRDARPFFRRRAVPTDRTARLFAAVALRVLPRLTRN